MGNVVVRTTTINEEAGTVSYNSCDAIGSPGNLGCGLAIRNSPRRLEFYERSTSSGSCLSGKAPVAWRGSLLGLWEVDQEG